MLRVRTLVLTALLVAIVALDAVADPAPAQTSLSATSEPPRAFGVGYQRGTGLGYYGTSFAMAATDRWTPSLAVFGSIGIQTRA